MSEKQEELLLTQAGLDQLKERLEYLRSVKRYEVAERIKIARDYGDLSENAEYDEAKTEQGFIEGEINEIENKIKNAKVISDDEISTEVISVGSLVRILNMKNNKEQEYRIVGTAESNLKEGKLSNVSPVGQGLIGHKKGEIASIQIPAGVVEYKILDIRR